MGCGIFLPKVLVGCGWRGVGVWIMGGWWVVVRMVVVESRFH